MTEDGGRNILLRRSGYEGQAAGQREICGET